MKVLRTFLGVLGIELMLFSAFCVAFAIVDLLSGDSKTERGVLWGILIFFIGTGMAGFFLTRQNLGKSAQESKTTQRRAKTPTFHLSVPVRAR